MGTPMIWEGKPLMRFGKPALGPGCCCGDDCVCPTECLEGFEVQIDGEPGSCWDADYSCYKTVNDYTDDDNWYYWELTASLTCENDEWSLLVAICGSETIDGVYTACTNNWVNASPFTCEGDGHPVSGEVELELSEGEVLCDLETITIPPTIEVVRS